MNKNELMLKSINDLLDKKFFIPAYQRGYRWTKRQVTDLLNDLQEFERKADDSEFYCLQPIVVKQYGDKWEIVDGQQRLTTIYIILTCLKDILPLLGKTRYGISYETRTDSTAFLENIDEDRAEENIDFFHIVEAKKAVEEWFKDKGNYRIKLIQTLLNEEEIGKNVKVIWYELGEHENATEVFTRLNMGKIPLVNAELVKALFLKSTNFTYREASSNSLTITLEQLRISQEWDTIEKSLQDDAFWYFLSKEDKKNNRIEFVLDLRANNIDIDENIISGDKLRTFLLFSSLFEKEHTNTSHEWLEIKKTFMTLAEWFNDRTLYHLIGYLVHQNVSIADITQLRDASTGKSDFKNLLIQKIFKEMFEADYSSLQTKLALREVIASYLSQLNYENKNDHPEIRNTLLLFNIVSLLSNPHSNARFQFENYKLGEWDIEHIRSVASDMPKTVDKQKLWLSQIIDYISGESSSNQKAYFSQENINEAQQIKETATRLISKTFNEDQFKGIYDRALKLYSPNEYEDVDNTIGNLSLLDSSTNRSYQNAIFPIKRGRIIALDKEATYVPLCTKNVFLKYYSKNVDRMLFWERQDSEDYLNAIIETMTEFFNHKELKK